MYMKLTASYKKSGKWYIGWIEEIPGVNNQGKYIIGKGCIFVREGARHVSFLISWKEKLLLFLDTTKYETN